MNVKIPVVPLDPPDAQTPPLLVRCVTPVPQLFTNISEAISTARLKIQADSPAIGMEPLPNGFLLRVDSVAGLQHACARLWGIDLTASTGVREFGLWDIEVLKNANNEDLSLLIRCANLLCEKVVPRKKTESCKSKSD